MVTEITVTIKTTLTNKQNKSLFHCAIPFYRHRVHIVEPAVPLGRVGSGRRDAAGVLAGDLLPALLGLQLRELLQRVVVEGKCAVRVLDKLFRGQYTNNSNL
jgi:hypothetical protein